MGTNTVCKYPLFVAIRVSFCKTVPAVGVEMLGCRGAASQKRYDHRKGFVRIKYGARLVEYHKAL